MREAGARIMLIMDGDVSGVMATSEENSGVDIYLGSGGAPRVFWLLRRFVALVVRCRGG